MNLTAIRDPEAIVVRHFGESFFLARKLAETGMIGSSQGADSKSLVVCDVGSGAGFPGIPLKIAYPHITLTLIEAQQRKTVFLKEVLRAIYLDVEVNNARSEDLARSRPEFADVVTLRAVERFEDVLPSAVRLVCPTGNLALLIGKPQVEKAQNLLKQWKFESLFPIPGSESRVIAIGNQSG